MTTVDDYLLQPHRDWSVEHGFGDAGDSINDVLAAWE
jgi:pyruvate dehydrogenase (quinone)